MSKIDRQITDLAGSNRLSRNGTSPGRARNDKSLLETLEIAFRTLRALRSADVQLTVLKGGGHRLSEPHEIEAILRTVTALLEPTP